MKQVVRAFLFNPLGQILLAQHRPNTPWVLPGGHVEGEESVHEAIIREIHEEFGIRAEFFDMDSEEILHHKGKKLHHSPLPLAIYDLEYKNAEGKDKSRSEYIFLMETSDTIEKTQIEEIHDFRWFDPDDILSMKPNVEVWDFTIEMLEKIIGEDEG
jgi:8-oxo-dGTP pyrophosphatase MutT (NUDIX family)